MAAKAPARDDRTTGEKINDYFVNDGPKLVVIIIWVLANVAVVAERWYHYYNLRPEVFAVMGYGVISARGAAAGLKLNCALILISVLRNFLSWLRGTFVGTYLPIDKNIVFHRYLAWTIAFYAFCHIVGHYFNYKNIAASTVEELAFLGAQAVPTPWQLAFTTLPGTTGAAGILEPPTFWMWFVGPGVLYALERTIRILRGNQETILQLAVAHPSRVLELQMKKSTFKYKPGQYLFLNCPYIAKQEWHPFTISSAPEEEFVSVHIRIVGDWTGDLWNFLNPNKKLGVIQENLLTAPDGSPIFRIDGPFGAASEDVFSGFKTVMLAAGGIGVTPFGSILKSIRYKLEKSGQTVIEKVYFYWISRDKTAFEWFNEVLSALEQENVNNFLEIHTYLTGQLSVDEIRNVMYGVDADSDQITGLQSPTHFGRPNWDEIFRDKAQKHHGTKIGVFFCGPAVLSKQLYKQCRKYTSSSTGTKFVYHKENF